MVRELPNAGQYFPLVSIKGSTAEDSSTLQERGFLGLSSKVGVFVCQGGGVDGNLFLWVFFACLFSVCEGTQERHKLVLVQRAFQSVSLLEEPRPPIS